DHGAGAQRSLADTHRAAGSSEPDGSADHGVPLPVRQLALRGPELLRGGTGNLPSAVPEFYYGGECHADGRDAVGTAGGVHGPRDLQPGDDLASAARRCDTQLRPTWLVTCKTFVPKLGRRARARRPKYMPP